jgi:hypothetical protein
MKIFLILVTTLLSFTLMAQTSPIGKWKTIDDGTKKPKSIVEIF